MAAVNLEELAKNEFWKRKLMTEAKVRDTNKDGFVSKEDYRIVEQRFKDMGVLEQHLMKLERHHNFFCMALGIVDDSIKLTYEECIANFVKCSAQVDEIVKVFETHFEIIDTNENGVISFKEWTEFYKALGIDTVHARASFDAMDANSDGIVSKEEFNAYLKEFYITADDKLNSSILLGPLN